MLHGVGHERIERAIALAQDLAPKVESMLFTHYPDADTLDTLRPGEESLEAVTALNRAAAEILAENGVRIFVQRADRAVFRRWMDERADTPKNRLAWIDRRRLLQGEAALIALGVDPKAAKPRTSPGRPAGSPASRLVRAFLDDDGDTFDHLANEILAAERDGVLEQAIRKVSERYDDEAVSDFIADLLAVSEGAALGPSGWAELMVLPVALPSGPLPAAALLAQSFVASGVLPDTLELRFLPEWRSAAGLAELSPGAVRRVLVDLVDGREPPDLRPADPADLEQEHFGVLLGVQFDWNIPVWENVAQHGLPDDPDQDDDTPEDAARAALWDRWRADAFEASGGCVPLALVPASEIGAEIAEFLDEAGGHTSGLDEIREFVDTARREVPEEEVVCRTGLVDDGLELTLYTRSGRLLDSMRFSATQLPVAPEAMPGLIEAFVPVVQDVPRP